MNKFIYLLLGVVFVSCQNNTTLLSPPEPDSELSKNIAASYAISPDSALANLRNFLETSESTRSNSSMKVASIIPIGYNKVTRGANKNNVNCENLIYIANFEQESGYAILAADQRISEKVIAITDEGSMNESTVYSALGTNNSEERIIFEGYPTTGPGFFTLPEYGDEIFMNPNTVSLYIEEVDDTLVGNFSLDDVGAVDENGNPIPLNSDIPSSPELLSCSLCTTYAINEIDDYENREVTNPRDEEDDLIGGSGGSSSNTRTETKQSDWTTIALTPNILAGRCKWSQDSPFNDLYPSRRKYLLLGHKRKAPAGCFPLSIAKVLAHLHYPDKFIYNSYTVNWNSLENYPTDNLSAATLLKGISEGCGSWYFYQGTFTFPWNATSYMRRLGLSNAHSHSYDFSLVTDMIDTGKPLLIYSVPGINLSKSHCWNIDGYKIKERTITTLTYKDGVLFNSKVRTETSKMVHCDFGWKGLSNGYYVSGVFKLNDANAEIDPGENRKGSTHYNHLLKVITY